MIKSIILLTLIGLISCGNWAILVAGSHTWSNYRHQADIYHAYQVLIGAGFPSENIITFAYDDIAHNLKNPFKGKVFNKPTFKDPGVDVYENVKIDYSKATVEPAIFLDVLLGNKTAVKGKGSERVLESTKDDNVFIFFSDHGAPGLIAFPNKYLYADSLLQTFTKMNGRYKKLVFYLESCESGSMFQKLSNSTFIYAVSAASPNQSSWGTYCAPNDVIQGKHIGSCLGDLFSVNFLEQTEKGDYWNENLAEQFVKLVKMTNQSHVMKWGDQSFLNDKVGEFVAGPKKSIKKGLLQNIITEIKYKMTNKRVELIKGLNLMDSRTIKLQQLAAIYSRERTAESLEEMTAEIMSMKHFDNIFSSLFSSLNLTGKYNAADINFSCLKPVMEDYENKCGHLSDYGLKYVRYFAQACQKYSFYEIMSKIDC